MKKSLLMILAAFLCALGAFADVTWKKVTTAPADWAGTYMIVAEGAIDGTKTVYFDGSLTTTGQNGSTRTLRGSGNYVETTLTDGAFTTTDDSQSFSVENFNGHTVLKSHSGLYLYLNSSTNGLDTSASPMNNYVSVSLNADGTAKLQATGGNTLQCSTTRFFFYSTEQSSKVYLYAPATELPEPEPEAELTVKVENGVLTITPSSDNFDYVYRVVSEIDYTSFFEKNPSKQLADFYEQEVLWMLEMEDNPTHRGELTVNLSTLDLTEGDYRVFASGVTATDMGGFVMFEEVTTDIYNVPFTYTQSTEFEPTNYGTFTTSPAPVAGEWQKGTKFYTIKVKRDGYLASDRKSGDYLTMHSSSKPSNDAGKWAFVQTEKGLQIYNKAAGTEQVLTFQSTSNQAHCSMQSDLTAATSYFECITALNTKFEAGYECFKITDSDAYLNHSNNNPYYLNIWTSDQALWGWNQSEANPGTGDDGSKMLIEFAEEIIPSTYTINVVGAPTEVEVTINGTVYAAGVEFNLPAAIGAAAVSATEIPFYDYAVTVEEGIITVTYTAWPDYYYSFENAAHSRSDRKLSELKLGEESVSVDGNGNYYQDLTETASFTITAGEEVKPAIIWTGGWMHGYVFVDKNSADRQFTEDELVASAPLPTPEASVNLAEAFSTFQIDEPGDYRMRYMIDWNSTCPWGTSTLQRDGGYIIDVMLHVQEAEPLPFELTVSNNDVTVENGQSATAANNGMLNVFHVSADAEIAWTGEAQPTLTVAEGSTLKHTSATWNAAGLLIFDGEGTTATTTAGDYTLTIPAGTFVNAAGTANAAYTATWTVEAGNVQPLNFVVNFLKDEVVITPTNNEKSFWAYVICEAELDGQSVEKVAADFAAAAQKEEIYFGQTTLSYADHCTILDTEASTNRFYLAVCEHDGSNATGAIRQYMFFTDANATYVTPDSYNVRESNSGLYLNVVSSTEHTADVVLSAQPQSLYVLTGADETLTIMTIDGLYLGAAENGHHTSNQEPTLWKRLEAEGGYYLAWKKGFIGFDTLEAGSAAICDKAQAQAAIFEFTQLNPTAIQSAIASAQQARLFDLQGRATSVAPARGLFIQNGHKVVR